MHIILHSLILWQLPYCFFHIAFLLMDFNFFFLMNHIALLYLYMVNILQLLSCMSLINVWLICSFTRLHLRMISVMLWIMFQCVILNQIYMLSAGPLVQIFLFASWVRYISHLRTKVLANLLSSSLLLDFSPLIQVNFGNFTPWLYLFELHKQWSIPSHRLVYWVYAKPLSCL